jgi:tetratricopeptide (TPR) repeat protein
LDMATYQLGMVSFEDKKYSEALGYFEGLIAQNKLLPQSNYWSGQINSMLGRKERAVAQFQQVVRMDSMYVREAQSAIASLTYKAPERPEPAPMQAARPKPAVRPGLDMMETQSVFKPAAPPKPKPITLDSIRK